MTARSLSRRTVVAGLAVAPAVPAAALDPPNPDAALLALKAKYDAADRAYEEACRVVDETGEAADVPPLPEALCLQNGDRHLGLSGYAVSAHPNGRPMYAVEPIGAEGERLRRRFWRYEPRPATLADGVPAGDIVQCRVPWPEAQSRADEIVAAWDDWFDRCGRAYDASGYTAATQVLDHASEALRAAADGLKASTPHTLAGLVALADFARRVQADEDCDGVLGGFLVRAILGFAESQPTTCLGEPSLPGG